MNKEGASQGFTQFAGGQDLLGVLCCFVLEGKGVWVESGWIRGGVIEVKWSGWGSGWREEKGRSRVM